MATEPSNPLGVFLKDRRAKLEPSLFGFSSVRRRTPGLRREEVAQRAHVSPTWYTWLEQGRGGAPSPQTLDRIAGALVLTDAERAHLFSLAEHREGQVSTPSVASITPLQQRVLDAMPYSPALIKSAMWDILAWNRAASVVLADYESFEPKQRNVLRMLFCNPALRAKLPNWESDVRMVVATFRFETSKAGMSGQVAGLVEELCEASPEFRSMWRDHDVRIYGEGFKHLVHPIVGSLSLEYSAYALDNQQNLSMVVYTAVSPADAKKVRVLIEGHARA